MAQQHQPQYEFHYQRVELLRTEELGVGSYGVVCKAMCDDLPCAAKILHRTLFQFTAPGATRVTRKFDQECRLLSAIKHPHIVQYLGTYHDPESRLPVLLMELMDESLTRFLERSNEPLPYHTEVNFCHDIALALSYLHSNGIVHRDLSSNNVLLIAGSRAKVTDFGMVKLYDVNRSTAHFTPLTLCPGTMAYMSPEALGEPPMYTDKLDSFSLGVLSVQIMTRQFPDPGDHFKIMKINDPRIPSGRVQVEVPEIERRQSHIDLIDPAHPLLPVALDCLKDRDRERPSCHELCGCMSTLKASPKYTESVQQSQSAHRESREIQQSQQIEDLQQQLHTQRNQLHAVCDQLRTQRDQLKGVEQENHQQRQQILELQTLLTAKDEQLAAKDEQLTSKDYQLQQKEEAIATHQQEIQQLRQQLHTQRDRLHALCDQLRTQRDQLKGMEQENHQQRQQILELQTLLTAKDEQLAGNDEQLASKDYQLQQKEAIATHQQEIQQLRQQLHTQSDQLHTKDDQLQEKEQENHQQRQQILELQTLLTAKDEQLADKDEQLAGKDEELAGKDEQLADKDEQLAAKDEQLASKDYQLQQKEAMATHQQEIQQLRQQLHTQSDQLHTKDDQLQEKEQENHQQRQQILELQTLLTAKDEELAGKDEQLAAKDERLAAKDEQLASKDYQLQQKKEAMATHQQETQQLRQQLHTQSDQLHTKDDQLQQMEQENQQQRQQILGLWTLLTTKDKQLAGKDHQLQQKQAAMAAHQQEIKQLRQQLQSSEQVAAEFQQSLLEREKTIQDQQRQTHGLKWQLRQRGGQRQEKGEASGAAASGGTIKLRWRDGGRAPRKVRGGVSAVDGNVAYFRPGGSDTVFAYNSTNNKWSELPKCPNSDFSLAMVNSLLTAIGGMKPNYEVTNSLLSLTDNKWTKQFPPMPTKHWLTAVVCSGRSLVVAGGVGEGGKYPSTVEVMDTETLQWSTASSLPHPLYQASATLCGDKVYMLGGFDQNDKPSKSVFTCSLAALLQSCQSQSLGERLKTLSSASRPEVWHQLADTSVTLFTCASLHGRLLAVGGRDSRATTAIHMYNTTTNSWEVISHMTTPRYRCLVVVLLHNELMVVGGYTPNGVTNSVEFVEFATIV